jgi:zinc transport system substrate-binding protein
MTRARSLSGILAIVGVTLLLGAGCQLANNGQKTNSTTTNTETVSIFTTFYPLQYFAEQVGGAHVTVTNMTPAGSEPHDFEPSARDVAQLNSADLFLVNGAELDHWAEDMAAELKLKGVEVVVMEERVDTREFVDAHEDEEGAEHEAEADDHSHGQSSIDPHFWLDPLNAQKEVEAIRDALIAVDQEHAEAYSSNAQKLMDALATLHTDYTNSLSVCEKDIAIMSHDAFGYVGDRYAIDVHSIAGISPEEEPTPQVLAELSDLAEAEGINYVFFETLVSPDLAETLANEVGAQTLVLNPIEGLTNNEINSGKNYFTEMRANLTNLRTALECQ